jgi:hypothetical protein
MAMSIHVHHGLIDGLQLGQFVDYFQKYESVKSFAAVFMFPIYVSSPYISIRSTRGHGSHVEI